MKSVVIVVCGYPRSGKDTLINAIGNAVATWSEALEYPTFAPISSIDPVKQSLFPLLNMLGIPLFEDGTQDLTKACRSVLASTKTSLDEQYKFTQAYLAKQLKALGDNSIVTYQVRELQNIQELDRLSKLKSSRFDLLTIWVDRKNSPYEPGFASDMSVSEVRGNWAFDLIVSSHLDDMDDWAALIMKYVMRKREQSNADL